MQTNKYSKPSLYTTRIFYSHQMGRSELHLFPLFVLIGLQLVYFSLTLA